MGRAGKEYDRSSNAHVEMWENRILFHVLNEGTIDRLHYGDMSMNNNIFGMHCYLVSIAALAGFKFDLRVCS